MVRKKKERAKLSVQVGEWEKERKCISVAVCACMWGARRKMEIRVHDEAWLCVYRARASASAQTKNKLS